MSIKSNTTLSSPPPLPSAPSLPSPSSSSSSATSSSGSIKSAKGDISSISSKKPYVEPLTDRIGGALRSIIPNVSQLEIVERYKTKKTMDAQSRLFFKNENHMKSLHIREGNLENAITLVEAKISKLNPIENADRLRDELTKLVLFKKELIILKKELSQIKLMNDQIRASYKIHRRSLESKTIEKAFDRKSLQNAAKKVNKQNELITESFDTLNTDLIMDIEDPDDETNELSVDKLMEDLQLNYIEGDAPHVNDKIAALFKTNVPAPVPIVPSANPPPPPSPLDLISQRRPHLEDISRLIEKVAIIVPSPLTPAAPTPTPAPAPVITAVPKNDQTESK